MRERSISISSVPLHLLFLIPLRADPSSSSPSLHPLPQPLSLLSPHLLPHQKLLLHHQTLPKKLFFSAFSLRSTVSTTPRTGTSSPGTRSSPQPKGEDSSSSSPPFLTLSKLYASASSSPSLLPLLFLSSSLDSFVLRSDPPQVFPEEDWLPWRFPQVPRGFWDAPENLQRYLNHLGESLSFKRFQSFYSLGVKILDTSLMRLTVNGLVSRGYPQFLWAAWKFQVRPSLLPPPPLHLLVSLIHHACAISVSDHLSFSLSSPSSPPP